MTHQIIIILKKLLTLSLTSLLFACQPPNTTETKATIDHTNHHTNQYHNSQTQLTNQKEHITHQSKKDKKPFCDNSKIGNAFANHQSDIQIQGCAIIIKALADDNKGSRHQRILVALDNTNPTQTLLIAHNIDLAPRIEHIAKGQALTFFGEYEYNEKGGVVHWTHHDPKQRHIDGWIEVNGKRYQ